MKRYFVFIFLIVAFALIGAVNAVTQSECGTLSTENTTYTLNQSVNSTGTCFTISANNVTLDCQRYLINFSQTAVGYGVTSTRFNDTTIKNCDIFQGNISLSSSAIYLVGAVNNNKNIDIYNNNLRARLRTIYVTGFINNSRIYNNSVSATTSSSIYFDITTNSDVNVSIYNNTIGLVSLIYGGSEYKIYNNNFTFSGYDNPILTLQPGTANVNISRVSIYNNSMTVTFRGWGIWVAGSTTATVKDVAIYNNTIRQISGSYPAAMITLQGSAVAIRNFTIFDNTLNTTGNTEYGIELWNNVIDTKVYGNKITTTSITNAYGIYLHQTVPNQPVTNNSFWNNTVTANSTRIYLDNVTGNTFENDTLIEGTTKTNNDIYSLDNATDNNFTNLNFNRSDIGFGAGDNNLTIKWFLTVNVTDSNGQLSFASIAVNDSANKNYSGTTGASGVLTFAVSDIKLSSTGSNISYNNHTITVSRTGYYTNTTVWNITSMTTANIFLTSTPTPALGTQFYGYGRSVRMNFAFHIGASKSNDEFAYNNTYVLANDSVVAGLVFSGSQDFGTVVNNSGTTDYSLQLKQSLEENRFYLVYTKAGWNKVVEKLPSIDKDRLLAKTFGDFLQTIPTTFPLFLRLDYYDIDIINRTDIARGELVIKNEGKNDRGVWMISMIMR